MAEQKKEKVIEWVTDNPAIAEKVQKGSGVIPAVTGSSLHGTRKYTFAGLTENEAKKHIKQQVKIRG